MGVKEFWQNRSYFQKGFIIGMILGLLAYFGYIIYAIITSSVPIPKLMLIYVFLSGLIISVTCGLIFGFCGFLIGLIRTKKWGLIIILLIGIIVLVILGILSSRARCIDSNEQCKGQPDGRGCTLGRWCDSFGRICGGRSCVGMSPGGKCFQGMCVGPEEYFKGMNVASIEDCEKTGDWYCYYLLAQKLSDANICNKIKDGKSKEWCILQMGDITSVEDCEKMEYRKSSCYYTLAQNLNNSDFCSKVEETYLKKKCQEDIEMSRLRKEFEIEYTRLDKYCETNEDCIRIDLGCLKSNTCINKNADVSETRRLAEAYDDLLLLHCLTKPLGCKCSNNICTTIS